VYKYGVIVSELSVNKYNIFAYPLCFEIKNRRQGPKTAGYRRKPAAISNPGCGYYGKEYSARHTFEPSSMTLAYVKKKYDEMGTSYSLVNGNCCHWASKLWDKLR
jgi:hypothetical protein